jgi:hypothetical protein
VSKTNIVINPSSATSDERVFMVRQLIRRAYNTGIYDATGSTAWDKVAAEVANDATRNDFAKGILIALLGRAPTVEELSAVVAFREDCPIADRIRQEPAITKPHESQN